MPLTTTATTAASGVGYSVEYDLADSADTTTASLTVTLSCADDDAEQFRADMLGYSEVIGGTLFRTLPEMAQWDGGSGYYCVRLDPVRKTPLVSAGAAQNNGAGWPKFDIATYRATFAIPLYRVIEDGAVTYEHERFCVWRARTTAQNEKIPGGGFQYIDDVTPANRVKINEVGVKTGRQTDLTCKWLDVRFVDYAKLSALCNKINSSAVTWEGTTYDAETVLFTGFDAEPRINGLGVISFDVTFSFSVKTDGRSWNKFWKNGTDKYVEVSSNGQTSGDRPFATADLNTIWSFT